MLSRVTLLAAALLLPAGSFAETPQVRISLSREDPGVQAGEWESGDPLEFHVWVEGPMLRGGEFGLVLEGAEFVSFLPDVEGGWMQLPIANGPPRTIAQVVAGHCRESPLLFGTLTVKPEKPGGPVVVDVTPSAYSNFALVLLCDNSPLNGLQAFPAGVNVNTELLKPHRVDADPASGGPAPEGESAAPGQTGSDQTGPDQTGPEKTAPAPDGSAPAPEPRTADGGQG